MSNVRTATRLTILYWSVAVVGAIVTPSSGWVDLRWPIAICLFAIPTTALLWLVVVALQCFRSPIPTRRFTLVGMGLPFVYMAVAWGGGHWLGERRQQRLTEQWRVTVLDTISDEPLLTAHGSIGVRLRYRVTYPKGLDLDEGHGAFAQVALEHMGGVFFTSKRTVTPHVAGAVTAGSYEITEDLCPVFLPVFIVDPKLDRSAYHCFGWNPIVSRQYVLTADAQSLVIEIALSGDRRIRKSTQHTYRLADFYDTALKEGGVNCDQRGRPESP